MKKFLLGFAFIASLAFMLTSCPGGGSKAKNSVSGSITIDADTEYAVSNDLKITIKLEDGSKFNAITNDNLSGESAWVTITPKVEANKLNGKFVLKDAVTADATTFDLYYTLALTTDVKTENPALNNAEYKVTISKDAIKDAEKDVELSGVFKVTVKSKLVVNDDAVVGFKSTTSTNTTDPTNTFDEYSVADESVTITLKGYSLNAKNFNAKSADSDTDNNILDLTSWFDSSVISKATSAEQISAGAKEVTVTLKYKLADNKANPVSTSANKLTITIPAADISNSDKNVSADAKYFVYSDNTQFTAELVGNSITANSGDSLAEKVLRVNFTGTCAKKDFEFPENADFSDAFIGTLPSNVVAVPGNIKAGDTQLTITLKSASDDATTTNVDESKLGEACNNGLIMLISFNESQDYIFVPTNIPAGSLSIPGVFASSNPESPVLFTITDNKTATLSNQLISAEVGVAVAQVTVTLTLKDGYKFKSELTDESDIAGFVFSLGPIFKLSDAIQDTPASEFTFKVNAAENATTATIKISAGKDALTSAVNGYLKVTIPASALKKGDADAEAAVTTARNDMCVIDVSEPEAD